MISQRTVPASACTTHCVRFLTSVRWKPAASVPYASTKLLAAQNFAVRLALRNLLVGVLSLRGQAAAYPVLDAVRQLQLGQIRGLAALVHGGLHRLAQLDRKSTRLNSSHLV